MAQKFRIIILGMLTQLLLSAQPSIQWQRTYGGTEYDEPTAIIATQNGNYVVVGTSSSLNGDVQTSLETNNIWILRLDNLGEVIWKKVYGGNDLDGAHAVVETPDSGFIVVGYTASIDGDVSGNHGDFDAWILKLDANGEKQWQKCLGGSGWEEAWSVDLTADGGYVIAGRSGTPDGDVTFNHGSLDYWVVKMDSLGNIQWQRSYGGSLLDLAYSIKQTTDGGYIVAGESSSPDGDVTNLNGNFDYWLIKLNFEGKIEWQKTLGGSALDRANKVIQTTEGDYVVLGQSFSNNGDVTGAHGKYDFWVVRLTKEGEILWQKALGGSKEEYGYGLQQTTDGGFVLAGQTQSTNGDVVGNDGGADFWIVKLDGDGHLAWQKSLGGTMAETGTDIVQTSDGGYAVTGYAWSNNGDVTGVQGKNDYWIVKLSAPSSSTFTPAPASLMLAPNPARDRIQLPGPPVESDARVRIIDALGRVHTDARLDASGGLDVSGLPCGVYWVEALGAVGKLVKE